MSLRRFLALLLVAALPIAILVGVAELALRIQREWRAPSYQPVQPQERGYRTDPLVGYRPDRFRGRHVTPSDPRGNPRIVILGGSTVYGTSVPQGETIAEFLTSRLQQLGFPDVEVLNHGVAGYTSWREYLLYEAYVRPLTPEVVVQFNGLNDVFYASTPEWPVMLYETQLLAMRQPRARPLVDALDATAFRGLSLGFYTENASRLLVRTLRLQVPSVAATLFGDDQLRPNERTLGVYRESERMMGRAVREDGGRLLLASQPVLESGDKRLTRGELEARANAPAAWQPIVSALYPRLIGVADTVAREGGFDYADLSRVFDPIQEATYVDDALHYTPLGNKLIADALAERLAPMIRHKVSDKEGRQ